jgi:large subunit ribosomal protein L15
MRIDEVHRGITKRRKRRRVGRGIGSGRGKTSARGVKGQGSRSGTSVQAIFEGGMMPLVRRIPKRGFNNPFAPRIAALNVGDLEAVCNAGDAVTPDSLRANGVLKGIYDQVKILGDGELSKKLSVSAHRFSKSAQEKIEKAGGTITIVPGPKPVEKGKKKAKE